MEFVFSLPVSQCYSKHKSEKQEFCFTLLIFCLSVFFASNKLFLPSYLTLHIVRTADHFFTGHFKTILQLCQKKIQAHISGYLFPISGQPRTHCHITGITLSHALNQLKTRILLFEVIPNSLDQADLKLLINSKKPSIFR